MQTPGKKDIFLVVALGLNLFVMSFLHIYFVQSMERQKNVHLNMRKKDESFNGLNLSLKNQSLILSIAEPTFASKDNTL